MTAIHLTHAAELHAVDGPTGRHVEVIRGELHDAGGNVLFAGTADECVEKVESFRLVTSLVPTEWQKVPEGTQVAGATHLWDCVTE